MKKIFGIIIFGCVIFFLIKGIAATKQEEEVLSINKLQQANGIPILVAAAQLGDVQQTLRFYGDIHADRQTAVSAKLMDNISEILVDLGDYVKKDQPLVKFDSTGSMSSVIQARLAVSQALRDLERAQNLWKQGAISKQMFEGAELQYEIANQNYVTAQRAMTLVAPVAGRVARIDLKPGDLTHPGDAVLTLTKENELEVRFDVTPADRDQMKSGLKIVATIAGRQITGKITKVSLITNPQSRMFKVYARIPYADDIYPGMLVTVDAIVKHQRNVLLVPADAVLTENQKSQVWVVNGNHAELREVSTGLTDDQQVEILAGLQVGDQVATYGQNTLVDGAKVKIVTQ